MLGQTVSKFLFDIKNLQFNTNNGWRVTPHMLYNEQYLFLSMFGKSPFFKLRSSLLNDLVTLICFLPLIRNVDWLLLLFSQSE